MDDRNRSPASSSSSTAVDRRFRHHAMEEEDPVACTGKSCQSCTAGAIADCVAVCCCPCAVVSIISLAFFKLPLAVARRCIGERRKKSRRRIVEERKCGGNGMDGILEKGRVEDGTLENVLSEVNDDFRGEEVWLEMYEIGHMGFGRVSFTGIPSQQKGN